MLHVDLVERLLHRLKRAHEHRVPGRRQLDLENVLCRARADEVNPAVAPDGLQRHTRFALDVTLQATERVAA